MATIDIPQTSGDERLEQGKRAYADGRAEEARAAFGALVESPPHAADALYGLGLLALNAGRGGEASEHFREAARRDPTHIHAKYHLGALAEQDGDTPTARALYEQVIAQDPAHAAARTRLAEVSRRDGATVPPPAAAAPVPRAEPPPGGAVGSEPSGAPAEFGVYEYLRTDQSPLSSQTVALMERLQFAIRPASLAFLPTFALIVLVSTVAFFDALFLESRFPGTLPWPASATAVIFGVACIAGLIVEQLIVDSYRITCSRGRLQVRSGLVATKLVNVELWRVNDLSLHRNWIDRITGHGALRFEVHNEERLLEVRGVARGQQLDALFQELLNMSFLLRSNPVVKGIIL